MLRRALVVALGLTACAGSTAPGSAPTTATSTSADDDLVAEAIDDDLAVYESPADDTGPERVLHRDDEAGGRLVLHVRSRPHDDGWVEVDLALRPNGTTGWVRADDVELATTPYRIVVDLGAHRLRVLDGDEVVVDATAGVGAEAPPLPGDYFLRDLLRPAEPLGDYGPFAYTLSGFAITTTAVLGGDGRLSIHGTNAPDELAVDGGPGSVRIRNDVLAYLVRTVEPPLGTPVRINP